MSASWSEPAVCFGSSQRSWVTDVISHVSDHGGLRVVGTVLTQDDAVAWDYNVLVIDDVSSVLTPRLVARLHHADRLVVAVFDAERGHTARERVLASGVDAAVASDASASEIVRAVMEVIRERSIDGEFARLVEGADLGGSPTSGESNSGVSDDGPRRGGVVVVTGSDGATEVAVGIARSLVDRTVSTVLVDMDTLEPSVAQRLGVRLTPNIFTATEHLRLRSSLGDAYQFHPSGFAVIGGIPNPREWENLSETEAADLIGELTNYFAAVVVKTSRHLEDLSGLAGGASRFDVARRIISIADHAVAVTSASPLGMTRLLSQLGDQMRLSTAPLHVLINRAPSSQFVRGEITDELHRSVTPASLWFLPDDRRVAKAAWQGDLVMSGPFAKQMAKVVDELAPRMGRRGKARSETPAEAPASTEASP